ncbi:PML protein, partial [Anseranas semipalmata]|nr:PML protein [Anseranas semipalmata]
LESEFQFVLCEGCRQESPSLKLLTCLHTLCLGCLSENKPIGQCPVCQTAIPQANGIPDTDNVLFASLQARLSVYRKILSGVELVCDNCKKDGEYWCSECEEFLCTQCFEAHQRYLKRESHEAKRVKDIRAGTLKDFLEGTKRTSSLSCSNPTHKNQTLSIYCKECRKPVCCICALLDTRHAGQHCDIGAEIQRRQEELAAASRELARRRSGFEASRAALQEEAARLEPFVKESLQELQRLRLVVDGDQAQHEDFAECRARLQALVERVEGHAEAAPAPATENSQQVLSASTPAKRKKDKKTNTLPSPVKVMKVEEDNNEWNMLQRPSCSDQPGTSSWAPSVALAREDCPLEGVPDSNSALHDLDNYILHLESAEEDSVDEESMDASLLDDLNYVLDDSTSKDYLGFPICLQNTMDTRQGSLVFFDVKILKNEIIQMAVVDRQQILPVLIQPVKCLSSLMAKNGVCEVGLRNLLCHLNTVHRPILGGFGLWSLPLPTLLKALTVMGKREEFSSVVYGFLDILPLIKERIPERDNYKLRNLVNGYLWQDLSDCSAMENARAVKDLCEVLDIDLVKTPRPILSHASLESFTSLQPLLEEKLLSKSAAQTLATHNIGLSELQSCYLHNPGKGLQKLCALINAHQHSPKKKIRKLSKVKVYFQRQQQPAESHETPAGGDLPKATKTKQN